MFYESFKKELSELDHDDSVGRDEVAYRHCSRFIKEVNMVSISKIQRAFRIGYNFAERIVKRMENEGLITPPSVSGCRKVVQTKQADLHEKSPLRSEIL